MNALHSHTFLSHASKKRSGRMAALLGVIAAGFLMVATCSPALAAANLVPSSISVSPSTVSSGQNATLTITLRNSGNQNALVDVSTQLPSGLTLASGSTTFDDVPVAAGATVYLTIGVQASTTRSRRVTLYVAFQSRNEGEANPNQMFLRFGSVTLTP